MRRSELHFLTRLSAVILIATVLAFSIFRDAARSDVLVHAAASLVQPIEDLLKQFSAKTGISVRVSYGSSGVLARQILAGAQGDIFISAHPSWTDKLMASGLAYEVRNFAHNRLNFVVRTGTKTARAQDPIKNWALLKQAVAAELKAGRLVTGNPAYSPLGLYTLKALECLGLSVQAHSRLIYANNARAALAFLQRGEVQAGFLYATDVKAYKTQTWERFDIPLQASGLIHYPAVQLSRFPSPEAGRLFTYLTGEESHEVLRSHGFIFVSSNISGNVSGGADREELREVCE